MLVVVTDYVSKVHFGHIVYQMEIVLGSRSSNALVEPI